MGRLACPCHGSVQTEGCCVTPPLLCKGRERPIRVGRFLRGRLRKQGNGLEPPCLDCYTLNTSAPINGGAGFFFGGSAGLQPGGIP
jgi:hypothetical protein